MQNGLVILVLAFACGVSVAAAMPTFSIASACGGGAGPSVAYATAFSGVVLANVSAGTSQCDVTVRSGSSLPVTLSFTSVVLQACCDTVYVSNAKVYAECACAVVPTLCRSAFAGRCTTVRRAMAASSLGALGQVTSSPPLPAFTSSRGSLTISFRSSNASSSTAFAADLTVNTVATVAGLPTACGGPGALPTIYLSLGYTSLQLTSASTYANNMNCSVLVMSAVPSMPVTFTLSLLALGIGDDFVTLRDGDSDALLATFSSSSTPATVTSTSSSMLITFQSDSSGTAAGFAGTLSSTTLFMLPNTCASTVSLAPYTAVAVAASPYPAGASCSVTLTATSVIVVAPSSLSLRPGTGDWLAVLDGGAGAPVLANWTAGQSPTETVSSSGPTVTIAFSSDGSSSPDGSSTWGGVLAVSSPASLLPLQQYCGGGAPFVYIDAATYRGVNLAISNVSQSTQSCSVVLVARTYWPNRL